MCSCFYLLQEYLKRCFWVAADICFYNLMLLNRVQYYSQNTAMVCLFYPFLSFSLINVLQCFLNVEFKRKLFLNNSPQLVLHFKSNFSGEWDLQFGGTFILELKLNLSKNFFIQLSNKTKFWKSKVVFLD